MAVCSYEGCTREVWGTSSFCILHDPDPEKDADLFMETVEEVIAQAEADPDPAAIIELQGVVFPMPLSWRGRTFSKGLHLTVAHFLKEANFGGATLGVGANFVGASFGGEANFGEANFWGASFAGRARFLRTSFPNDPHLCNFQNVLLERPEVVFFEHVNLSRASLLGTDMSRVHLVGVEWREPPAEGEAETKQPWWRRAYAAGKELAKEFLKLPRQRLFLYDHFHLPEDMPVAEHCHMVELLYRQLRLNLEGEKQNGEAGEFYVGEMEMKRMNPKGPGLWGPRGLLRIYGRAAVYGESWGRPFLLYLLLGLPFAFLYLWSGFRALDANIAYNFFAPDSAYLWPFVRDFFAAWLASLTAALPLGQDFRPLSGWTWAVRYLDMALDVLLLALSVIALRRRFRR